MRTAISSSLPVTTVLRDDLCNARRYANLSLPFDTLVPDPARVQLRQKLEACFRSGVQGAERAYDFYNPGAMADRSAFAAPIRFE
jgi:hypothetical protein